MLTTQELACSSKPMTSRDTTLKNRRRCRDARADDPRRLSPRRRDGRAHGEGPAARDRSIGAVGRRDQRPRALAPARAVHVGRPRHLGRRSAEHERHEEERRADHAREDHAGRRGRGRPVAGIGPHRIVDRRGPARVRWSRSVRRGARRRDHACAHVRSAARAHARAQHECGERSRQPLGEPPARRAAAGRSRRLVTGRPRCSCRCPRRPPMRCRR